VVLIRNLTSDRFKTVKKRRSEGVGGVFGKSVGTRSRVLLLVPSCDCLLPQSPQPAEIRGCSTKVNHLLTFQMPSSFTFRSGPIIFIQFIQLKDYSTRFRFCWLVA